MGKEDGNSASYCVAHAQQKGIKNQQMPTRSLKNLPIINGQTDLRSSCQKVRKGVSKELGNFIGLLSGEGYWSVMVDGSAKNRK